MYVGFRYHHRLFPGDSRIIVGLNPTRVQSLHTKTEYEAPEWTPINMKKFVDKGFWVPEESLTTVILKALKNAL